MNDAGVMDEEGRSEGRIKTFTREKWIKLRSRFGLVSLIYLYHILYGCIWHEVQVIFDFVSKETLMSKLV